MERVIKSLLILLFLKIKIKKRQLVVRFMGIQTESKTSKSIYLHIEIQICISELLLKSVDTNSVQSSIY